MSDKLIVNWNDYNNTVEKLAIKIEESNYKPTILIGIMIMIYMAMGIRMTVGIVVGVMLGVWSQYSKVAEQIISTITAQVMKDVSQLTSLMI